DMTLQSLSREAKNKVCVGAQTASSHVHPELFVRLHLDGGALYVSQNILIERLNRLIEQHRAVYLLDRFDDAVRTILACGGIYVRRPAELFLCLAEVARDLRVALVHVVVRV